jgi:SulP family sulfate permease
VKRFIAPDLFAGLILFAVFAAQALAYSRLAHATATAGLITAICGVLIYAVVGSSRRISIGPAVGIAAIVGATVAGLPADQLAPSLASLTLMTGAFLFIAGLLRLEFLQRLFPAPVFVGYLAGIGVVILVGQGRELVATPIAFGIGAVTIGLTLLLEELAPRFPAPFAVLLLATMASALLGFEHRGVPVIGESLGHLAVPSFGFDWAMVRSLFAPALGLALIVYVDAIASANTLARHGDTPVSPVRELYAFGTVNLVAGLWGGFVAGTSSSRGIAGIQAGAKGRLASAIAGVLLLLTALSVVRFLAPMPLPALSGVVFVAAFALIDVERMRELYRLRRADFLIASIAGASVVFVGMLEGIAIGIAVALVEAFRRAMNPPRSLVSGRTPDRYYEPFTPLAIHREHDLLVYRFGAGLFFGNAEVFLRDMRQIAHDADPSLHTVVVNADGLGVPDATARDCLVAARTELDDHGIDLVFGNVRKAARDALEKIGGFAIIDEPDFIAAVRRVRAG